MSEALPPGTPAPVDGAYRCDGGCDHRARAARHDALPALPEGCRGRAWIADGGGGGDAVDQASADSFPASDAPAY